MSPLTVLLITFLLSGALLIGLSVPLIQGRIAPNHWYGFRVRRTLEDAKVWYPANAYAASRLLWVGVVEIVVATALYLVPNLDVATYGRLVGGVVVIGLIFSLVQSLCYLRGLSKENTDVENKA